MVIVFVVRRIRVGSVIKSRVVVVIESRVFVIRGRIFVIVEKVG